MIKITIVKEPVSNTLIGHVDSLERSDRLFESQEVVASFDVSDLYIHSTEMLHIYYF